MTENELRKGNLILNAHGRIVRYDHGIRINFFKPIPLTDEWFENFGLIRMYVTSSKEGTPYIGYGISRESRLRFYSIDNRNYILICNGDYDLCEIKYVHQLQNIFWCLTENELSLK